MEIKNIVTFSFLFWSFLECQSLNLDIGKNNNDPGRKPISPRANVERNANDNEKIKSEYNLQNNVVQNVNGGRLGGGDMTVKVDERNVKNRKALSERRDKVNVGYNMNYNGNFEGKVKQQTNLIQNVASHGEESIGDNGVSKDNGGKGDNGDKGDKQLVVGRNLKSNDEHKKKISARSDETNVGWHMNFNGKFNDKVNQQSNVIQNIGDGKGGKGGKGEKKDMKLVVGRSLKSNDTLKKAIRTQARADVGWNANFNGDFLDEIDQQNNVIQNVGDEYGNMFLEVYDNRPNSKPHKDDAKSPNGKPHKGDANSPNGKPHKGDAKTPNGKPHKGDAKTPNGKPPIGDPNSPNSKPHA